MFSADERRPADGFAAATAAAAAEVSSNRVLAAILRENYLYMM